ncbi:solute carrier family 35 member G1-like [Ptychodera flava]|uniref:solute carrier family 35 member G1-like n=1 Tax=Ptychodera flava TaxID=63121 RepID=UPI00396A91A7
MAAKTGLGSRSTGSDNNSSIAGEKSADQTQRSSWQRVLGLLLAVGAGVSTACASTMTKLMKDDLPPLEVVFYRGVMNATVLYSYLVVTGRANLFKGIDAATIGAVLIRSVFFVVAVTISFAVNQQIPLGDASALMGTSTVMTGLLGIFILNEKWHLPDMLISLLCWAGVLLISRPASLFGTTEGAVTGSTDSNSVYYMLALVAAVMTSLSFLFVRKIGKSIDVGRLVLFSETVSMVVCFVILQSGDDGLRLPSPNTWKYLPWLSLASMLVQILMTFALYIEKAATAVVCRTAGLVTASFVTQIFIFKNTPEMTSVIGALLILLSTALLSFRKMRQEKVKQL